MYGRRPRCKRNLTFSARRSGAAMFHRDRSATRSFPCEIFATLGKSFHKALSTPTARVARCALRSLGNPANVDPEEAFVAALSSCHMLTFLAIA
jgi:organic hydroperoxide reductase OsmC/OhrA